MATTVIIYRLYVDGDMENLHIKFPVSGMWQLYGRWHILEHSLVKAVGCGGEWDGVDV